MSGARLWLTDLVSRAVTFKSSIAHAFVEVLPHGVLGTAFARDRTIQIRSTPKETYSEFTTTCCLGNLGYLNSVLNTKDIFEAGQMELDFSPEALRKAKFSAKRLKFDYNAKRPDEIVKRADVKLRSDLGFGFDFGVTPEMVTEYETILRAISAGDEKADTVNLLYQDGKVQIAAGSTNKAAMVFSEGIENVLKPELAVQVKIGAGIFRSVLKANKESRIYVSPKGVYVQSEGEIAKYIYIIPGMKQ